MKYLSTSLKASVAAILLAGAVVTASADENDAVSPSDAAISIHQAVDIATAQIPGSVIEAELENEDGSVVWEITVASAEKQVVELVIDANSGAILGQQMDDG